MAYSEHARRYLADCGLPKERTYVTGSPMAEVLHNNLKEIEASDIHKRLNLEKGRYILLSAHREENIDTEKNFLSLFNAINAMADMADHTQPRRMTKKITVILKSSSEPPTSTLTTRRSSSSMARPTTWSLLARPRISTTCSSRPA